MNIKKFFNNKANLSLSFLNKLDLSSEVIDKLSLLLSRTYRGSSEVLETPIAKGFGALNALGEIDKLFANSPNRFKINDVLMSLEEDNRSKFGARSIAKSWEERKTSLYSSFMKEDNDNADKLFIPSGSWNLRPISLSNAIKLLKNSTNSGLPYYDRKGVVKERVLRKFKELLQRRDPSILFTRTQENNKTRDVWGYPIADTLNEMRYYKPLLDHQKTSSYRSALVSPDRVNRSITRLIKTAIRDKDAIISIDFSAYDTSVKSQLQRAAFNYIKSLFQRNCGKDLDYIAERFSNIGIVTPDGLILGSHGVPSGSTFTNEVDSIVQYLISLNIPGINHETIQIQGDDGVYAISFASSDDLFSKFESYGLKVNRDKSYISSNHAVYLQNLYHFDYIDDNGIISGIYSIYRALNRILYQERWSNFEDYSLEGKHYYSIRTICILENCKHHPCFEEFVKLIYSMDKYSLDYSDQSLANYVKMISMTEGVEGILNNQYGDNVRGLNNFESVKIIKRLG